MTILEEINALTWHNGVNKVKSILKRLLTTSEANAVTYKTYSAILTQTGTDQPTVEIIENNLDFTIAWTLDDIENPVISGTYSSSQDADKIHFLCTLNESSNAYISQPNVGSSLTYIELFNLQSDVVVLDGRVSIEIKVKIE